MNVLRRARVPGGLLLAAIAISLTAAACLPRARPPSPAGQLSLSPASLDYGSHPLANLMGANMPIINVTVTNTGGQAARMQSETSSNGIYSIPTNTCAGASLAPGQSCRIGVQFCPNTPGTATSTLTVTGMTGPTTISSTANVTGIAT